MRFELCFSQKKKKKWSKPSRYICYYIFRIRALFFNFIHTIAYINRFQNVSSNVSCQYFEISCRSVGIVSVPCRVSMSVLHKSWILSMKSKDLLCKQSFFFPLEMNDTL